MRLSTIATRLLAGCLWLFAESAQGAAPPRHPLQFGDIARLREVSDLQLAPEGDWVAYQVQVSDLESDRFTSDLFLTRWDATRTLQLTHSQARESHPRFSPDGRFLAFLSDRDQADEKTQVWLLDRAGGEARKLTALPGGVSAFEWAPNSRRLALVAGDPDPDDAASGKGEKSKVAKPIVIDRYQFKQDGDGYLRHLRSHLYAFDLGSLKPLLLTPGDFDEALPAWSPDSSQIAFSSKRTGDPDRHDNWDLYVIEAREAATPRRLTSYAGADADPDLASPPAWSPDGRQIVYVRGGEPRWHYYDPPTLAVVAASGGEPRLLTPALDRAVTAPRWSSDGSSVYFLLEDDRNQQLARVSVTGGAVERLTPVPGAVQEYDLGPRDRIAVVATTALEPAEVMALERGALRPLSTQNAALLGELQLGAVEPLSWPSADGTEIHGLLWKPPAFVAGQRHPTVVYLHGGPVAQDDAAFDEIRHTLAAHGYLVVGVNYRGSSGRGHAFSRAIYADWGHLEVQDVQGAVDALVARGLADPERLGIGGWSYGGMTTNYVIASDPRFKAALSGASIANQLTGYGTDQYIRQYESELGLPWQATATYLKVSYPFFHADRIRTPTLFLCGESDFNVPLVNSEQMYQALRSLGVPTQLVIYPDQYHHLERPSYLRDRLERYVAWLDRHLKPVAPAPGGQ